MRETTYHRTSPPQSYKQTLILPPRKQNNVNVARFIAKRHERAETHSHKQGAKATSTAKHESPTYKENRVFFTFRPRSCKENAIFFIYLH